MDARIKSGHDSRVRGTHRAALTWFEAGVAFS
jgi:hypothetical protein